MRGVFVCALLAAVAMPVAGRADDGPMLPPVPVEMEAGPLLTPADGVPGPLPPPPYPLGTVTTPGRTLAPDTLAPAVRGGRRPIIGFFRCVMGGCPPVVEDAGCQSSRSYCTLVFGSCRSFWAKPDFAPPPAPPGSGGSGGGCGCR